MSQDVELPPAYEDHQTDLVFLDASQSMPASESSGSDLVRPFDSSPPLPAPPADSIACLSPSASAPELADTRGPVASKNLLPDPCATLPPPDYARQDPEVRTFTIQPPFVCSLVTPASSSSSPASSISTPRFQLRQVISSLGKPYKLSIRRLTTSESRRASLTTTLSASSSSPSPSTSAGVIEPRQPNGDIDYDDDFTLYEATNTAALRRVFGVHYNPEIRGCKARTLPGHIELADLSTRSGACRFWHVTPASTTQRRRADARMQRWGYRPQDDWCRRLLFVVEGGRSGSRAWKHGSSGERVALESGCHIELLRGVDMPVREALLTCWTVRLWMMGQLEPGNQTR
ncbi:hypothetical protein ACRALDRAFT_2023911 [Sodiomyces alcalophilus JCM 7366]|uniref:uncharacterized protein n=1 Tax=Sodiomyces alcalophilus JCM 7366 TaxID=591952 RepID=UPI0039B6155B